MDELMAAQALPLDQADEPEQLNEEEHAEQIPDSGDPPTYGTNNRDLPQQLKDAIGNLVKTFSNRDQYDRRIEVLMDRIMRFYDDGVQHVYPNWGTGVYQIGVAGGFVDLGGGKQIECPEYMGAYNIFRSRRRSIHAVLTQNPPGIDFIPNKLGDPEGEQSAEIAEGYRHFFDQANDTKGMQEDVSRMMCLSGRVVTRTYTTQDAQRWGYNDQGEPKSMETCKVYGTLETRVPITCRDFDKMVFCFIYEDPDVILAKAQNSWIRSKIGPGESALGESDWERYARLGVKQARKGYYLTGQALAHLTTEMHGYMRPSAFEDGSCDDVCTCEPPDGYEWQPDPEDPDDPEQGDTGQTTIRGALKQLFPEGIHVKYIGKTYSEAWAEAIDDAVDIGFPDARDGMTGGALMEPMKVIQDVYNDYKNAERENYEKGWPATYFKGSANDYNAIADTRSAPGRFHLLKDTGAASTIEGQVVYREPDFSVPQSFVQAQEELRGALSQDVTGALPALSGEQGKDTTATQNVNDRSQAMGMLGPPWANIQRMFAGIYTKACLLASKNPDHGKEIAVLQNDGTKATLQLRKIKKGTFKAKPDVDSSFPESTAAKRQNMTALLTQIIPTPLGAAMFQSPDNWQEIIELNGNPDITLVPAIAYKKQMRELELLLEQPPVPNMTPDGVPAVDAYNQQHASQTLQGIGSGQPPPPYQPPPPLQPSIMPEPDDFHQWESMKCAEYLSGEDCWTRMHVSTGDPQKDQAMQAGVQNVRLHKAIHDQMLAAQAPPPMPPMPHGAPPPPPGASGAPEAGTQVQQNTAPPGGGGPTL